MTLVRKYCKVCKQETTFSISYKKQKCFKCQTNFRLKKSKKYGINKIGNKFNTYSLNDKFINN